MKFNIGCGHRNFGNDWIHIDGGSYDHLNSSDIFIPTYDKNIADLIYASHLIEYFNRNEVEILLKRWKEVLKPNGVLRLAVPNFEIIANLYINRQYPLDNFLGPLYGKMKMSKNIIYHKTTYDFTSLEKLLKIIGMKKIRKYDWRKTEHSKYDDHSQAYLPHMDKKNGILLSLNVECIK
jgi:predicted SAM-dependent methyltransferase